MIESTILKIAFTTWIPVKYENVIVIPLCKTCSKYICIIETKNKKIITPDGMCKICKQKELDEQAMEKQNE